MSGSAEAAGRSLVVRCLIIGLLGASLVLALGSGHASTAAPEVYGELVFAESPLLIGGLEGHGTGEVQLFPGEGLEVKGEGARIVVEEYRLVSVLVDPPMMPPNELQDPRGEAEEEAFPFHEARFAFGAPGEGFESLLMATGEDDRLSFSSGYADSHVTAVKDPGLVLDERWENNPDAGGDSWRFTYLADGHRFPFEADAVQATGAPSLYLWDAEFTVEGDGGSRTFSSGAHQEEVAPGLYQHIEVYHIVKVEQGAFDVVGEHVAWLNEPRIDLEGTLTSGNTEGLLGFKGDEHRLDGMPFSATGSLEVRPLPQGEPVPPEPQTIGISSSYGEVYPSSRATMSGDGSVAVTLAGKPVVASGSGLPPVAATVGIIGIVGAALALTPQGKWALVGALAPLYAKTQRDRLLESPQRERLVQAIQANPGVHISRLRELAELSWGTTVYHLRLMEKNGLVTSVPRAGQRHFFIKTPGVDAARLRGAVSAIVGQDTAHRVAFAVLNMPGASQKSLAEHLGVSSRVVAHHISRLVKADLVTKKRDGGFIRCYPTSQLGDALAILDTGEVPSMAVTQDHQDAHVPVVQA